MSKPFVAVAAVALSSVAFMFLFAGWEQGFSQGARQATDQILAEQDQTSEVIRLQAQLDERRRTEDRISNTVLAAFTAGATVLVVVNIVALVFAQQSYQRDKDALQTVLVQEAKALDLEGFENWSSTLTRTERELRERINQDVARIETRLGQLDSRLDTATDTASLLLARQIEASADKAEAEGDHVRAADNSGR